MSLKSIQDYISRKSDLISRPLVAPTPESEIKHVIAIPVLAEKENLPKTLGSLAANVTELLGQTLVICVVNNRRLEITDPTDVADNRDTILYLKTMMEKPGALRLAYVDASSPGKELPDKEGVGSARKIGLDWGAAVLAQNNEPQGTLISLDADTLVEHNYLAVINDHFSGSNAWAAVLSYAHPVEGSDAQVRAAVAYELFLRYHVLGLHFAHSPYAFPTIGSTMCCTAEAYAAVSGMNQRQAGEDFYFLQQLAKTGPMAQISATTVHPSGRASSRVPFGTGRRVLDYEKDPESAYLTYDARVYETLRDWLDAVSSNLSSSAETILGMTAEISPALRQFLIQQRLAQIWPRLQNNARDHGQLIAQFHRWFDGFKTLKLIHYLRDNGYPRKDLLESIHAMLKWCQIDFVPPADWQLAKNDLDYQRQLLEVLRHPPVI